MLTIIPYLFFLALDCFFFFFFFNDTAPTEIYTLSLHDALPIRTARAANRASRHALPITTRVSSATTSGPSRRTSLRTVDSSGTRSAQGDQAEPPQVQGVGYLPQQRLVPPAGALLDNHQPHEAGHRDRRPTVPARRRLPHPFDRRQQQPIGQ